ncbi:MAG: archease [Armatimonadota bacterium]
MLKHTADIAIRVWGPDLPALFANAATALFDIMAESPAEESVSHEVIVSSLDREALLVDWLNELIFLHEVNGETYNRFIITVISPSELQATVIGGRTRRKLKTVKAATYHDLSIRDTAEGVEAHIVFDV